MQSGGAIHCIYAILATSPLVFPNVAGPKSLKPSGSGQGRCGREHKVFLRNTLHLPVRVNHESFLNLGCPVTAPLRRVWPRRGRCIGRLASHLHSLTRAFVTRPHKPTGFSEYPSSAGAARSGLSHIGGC
jgi:hypothetical protein